MEMEELVVVAVRWFLAASLLLLHHHAATVSGGGGFSLRLAPVPGLNRTIRVDANGFLHVLQDNDDDVQPSPNSRLRPHVVGFPYSVAVTVGTGRHRPTYSLALDTITTDTWIQCLPVDGKPFPQTPPPFDPSLVPQNRSSPLCSFDDPARCHFEDGSSVTGLLVRDTFAFHSTDAGGGHPEAELPGFLFGCAHHIEGFQSHGVLSLGRRRTSLSMDLAQRRGVHRFSYCLVAPRWSSESGRRHSFLRFGDDVPATGHMPSTRMLYFDDEDADGIHNRLYSVTLVGLSVAGRRLPGVDRSTFTTKRYGGGAVIDLGTTTMVMVEPGYRALERAVGEHVKHLGLARVSYAGYEFCLRLRRRAGMNKDDDVWRHLPTVTLHFEEPGVELVLRPQSMFVAVAEHICLAVEPGPAINWSTTIIGAMQQVDTRFIFDLTERAMHLLHSGAVQSRLRLCP